MSDQFYCRNHFGVYCMSVCTIVHICIVYTVHVSEIVTGQAAQARPSQIWEMGCLNNSKFSCNV